MFHPTSIAALFALTLTSACSDPSNAPVEATAGEAVGDGAPLQRHAPARPLLSLVRPTGPFAVGVRTTFVLDSSRLDALTGKPRALPTWVYYPAFRDDTAERAPYLPTAVRVELETQLGLPPGLFAVDTGVLDAPEMRAGYRGVLLVSGGWGTPVAFETSLVSELASHGYVLIAFDHPHDTFMVEQPESAPIAGMTLAGEEAFAERVLDVGVVLERLGELVPRLDGGIPIAMWGHSLGGAAAVESLRLYPRLVAAVDLDGTPRGPVVELGTREPVGILSSNAFVSQGLEDTLLATLIENLRGPHVTKEMYEIGHYGFSDFVLFNAQAARRAPAVGALLEANFKTDSDSVEEGRAAIAAQRAFLVRFMDRYVARRWR